MFNPKDNMAARIVYQALGEYDSRSVKIDNLVSRLNRYPERAEEFIKNFVDNIGDLTDNEISYIQANTCITISRK